MTPATFYPNVKIHALPDLGARRGGAFRKRFIFKLLPALYGADERERTARNGGNLHRAYKYLPKIELSTKCVNAYIRT